MGVEIVSAGFEISASLSRNCAIVGCVWYLLGSACVRVCERESRERERREKGRDAWVC